MKYSFSKDGMKVVAEDLDGDGKIEEFEKEAAREAMKDLTSGKDPKKPDKKKK